MSKKDDMKKSAKMSALKDLHSMVSKAMSDDMENMQKVSVMAEDDEGLMEGLEKAEELLEKKKKDEDED
jgi:hypothetical protein